MSNEQVHSDFKVFMGDLAPDHTLGALAGEVSHWAAANKIAAKSIGVEYLESAKKLVLTIGYKKSDNPYPIELQSVSLGHFTIDAEGGGKLEKKMSEASEKVGDVICHELYVTEDHDFLMVFLIKK